MTTERAQRAIEACEILARATERGQYDWPREAVLIQHPRHGLLLAVEGWGGGGIPGESYRYRHGMIYRVPESIGADIHAALAWRADDYYAELALPWDGFAVESVVEAAQQSRRTSPAEG